MKTFFFDSARPRVMAHRGYSSRCPENTLLAFEAAAPVTGTLELDVWRSADGEVVVHHDETLRRTCGDPRPIHALTLPALEKLDAGWGFTDAEGRHLWRDRGIRIPTLREVFRRFPGHRCVVEIKHDAAGLEWAVDALAREAGLAERVLIASEHDANIHRMRERFPDYPTNLPAGEVVRFIARMDEGGQGEYRSRGRLLTDPAPIRAAHALDLEVHYWTNNDPVEMKNLLALGTDGLFTDDPALAAEVVLAADRGA